MLGGDFNVIVTGLNIRVNVTANFGVCNKTASEIKTLIEASAPAMALISVALKSGNDGSGTLGSAFAFGPTSLAGGNDAVEATSTPPFIRAAGGFLYVQESGIWKKAALSSL